MAKYFGWDGYSRTRQEAAGQVWNIEHRAGPETVFEDVAWLPYKYLAK
ncbi:hypothetical protein RR42_s3436 [Cupriavidus basilensis]|uniref:Uncharacterized protein n=1 Tax=Cupriavidus basilensis TaxID=68895 RepID=A0A0C4YGM2_9BURK|nr:hypothetical protein RR42_s3436 [Cupriavidus basilensis]